MPQAPTFKAPNYNIQMTTIKTGLEFRILVIVICLIFAICYLEFPIIHLSITPGA
jgi:hypothetical protein